MTSFGVVAPSSDKRKEMITSLLKVIHWGFEFLSTSIIEIWLVSRKHTNPQSNYSFRTNIAQLRCFAWVCRAIISSFRCRESHKLTVSTMLWLIRPHSESMFCGFTIKVVFEYRLVYLQTDVCWADVDNNWFMGGIPSGAKIWRYDETLG